MLRFHMGHQAFQSQQGHPFHNHSNSQASRMARTPLPHPLSVPSIHKAMMFVFCLVNRQLLDECLVSKSVDLLYIRCWICCSLVVSKPLPGEEIGGVKTLDLNRAAMTELSHGWPEVNFMVVEEPADEAIIRG
ncbi:hypothetical protein L1987_84522 [Smallanthus sonchifolius]|uniref:Uncharacterized protein n=1 Tax=Smallanthus sonchifolius TaxID=185202 RepID=A0ACB8YEX7_9ASTR|nr:hypothetical protein L1987_84522 [Smallanthus sonchifolius]